MSRTELQLQDSHINLDDLTEYTDSSLFRLEHKVTRPFERYIETIMAITIEANLDQIVTVRETQTTLDVLADVGGFAEVLAFGSSMIL